MIAKHGKFKAKQLYNFHEIDCIDSDLEWIDEMIKNKQQESYASKTTEIAQFQQNINENEDIKENDLKFEDNKEDLGIESGRENDAKLYFLWTIKKRMEIEKEEENICSDTEIKHAKFKNLYEYLDH